jgi:acetylornithine deacetylase/succinyl-diaminopimelate desuccinylase-like protein
MSVTEATAKWVEEQFAKSIVPSLVEYIKIPNKSAMFDPDWKKNGHVDRAVELMANWAKANLPEGAKLEVVQLQDNGKPRTPVIFIDIPGTGGKAGDTVMLYGHLDKQPEMTGWREGLGPWTPVIEGDKLYGRGGADDGYAIFASLTAINAVRRDKLPHARCVILIEAGEESGSYDLPA